MYIAKVEDLFLVKLCTITTRAGSRSPKIMVIFAKPQKVLLLDKETLASGQSSGGEER